MNQPTPQDDPVYVVGAGAQTPVGRYVLAAAAAVRCGISAYAEHSCLKDRHGEPVVVARAPWLDEAMPLEDRIATLAADAAQEAMHPLAPRLPALRAQTHLHLALSAEALPEASQRQRLTRRVAGSAGLTATDSGISTIVEGHAGGLLALEQAVKQLRAGTAALCLVGGADSWISSQRLAAVESDGRLHSINNSWGFTPGEAAGFCLLARRSTAARLALKPLCQLLTVATSRETRLLGQKSVCIGEGLTAAFRQVLDRSRPVAHSYCDLNGETYRAEEYGFAICRTAELFQDAGRFTAPAECWGDVGAASGLLALTLPLAAWARGYAHGSVALVCSSSATSGLRGALLAAEVPLTGN